VSKTRLEAFSDGVIAILITIMVLDLRSPSSSDLSALGSLLPDVAVYLLSFVFLGIYWNNHHHVLQATSQINGAVLWANLHLLFWLSLYPFTTKWMDEFDVATVPVVVYGINLLAAAIAYYVLQLAIMGAEGPDSRLRLALGRDVKGKLSPVIYAVAIALCFVNHWFGLALYVVVALLWLVPDPRVERQFAAQSDALTRDEERSQARP
jgi:uncharacterized membrane protein